MVEPETGTPAPTNPPLEDRLLVGRNTDDLTDFSTQHHRFRGGRSPRLSSFKLFKRMPSETTSHIMSPLLASLLVTILHSAISSHLRPRMHFFKGTSL